MTKQIPFQLILFIFCFGFLSLFINTNNTVAYGLQSEGIKSIVERGTIHLDSANDNFQGYVSNSTWDVFPHNGHVYLAKQPGQFFIGSIVYLFLNKLRITYNNNNVLVCGLIALFTSCLMTALMIVFMFNIAFNITKSRIYSLINAIVFGFGTLVFPYSGILHHDICATFFLFSGFYFLFYNYQIAKTRSNVFTVIAGLSTGFAFFCSFNTLTIIFLIGLYVLFQRKIKDLVFFTVALIISLSTSFLFNLIVFGNPLSFSISLYTVFHHFSNEMTLQNYLSSVALRINQYLISPITAITFYSPIFLVSYLGLFLLSKKYFNEKIILLLVFLLQLIQPSLQGVIGGFGWCQYGSRYLLESMPFTLVGLSGFFEREKNTFWRLITKTHFFLIYPLAVISIIICATGTMGVVYCGYYQNAFLNYISRIIARENLPNYYLMPIGASCILVSVLLFFSRGKNKIN